MLGTKMDISLSEEKQGEYIDKFVDNMATINEGLPALAGEGNLVDALEFLELELAAISLHAQRTGILISSILEFMAAQAATAGFKKTGSNFDGTPTPIN